MSQFFKEKFLRESGFPFLVGNFMLRDGNWFFGRHFVTVYPIFDFLTVFWFFWITLSVAHIPLPNSFGKVLFWVRVHLGSPLTTNGSTLYLDHLSVKAGYPGSITSPLCALYSFSTPLSISLLLYHQRVHLLEGIPTFFFPMVCTLVYFRFPWQKLDTAFKIGQTATSLKPNCLYQYCSGFDYCALLVTCVCFLLPVSLAAKIFGCIFSLTLLFLRFVADFAKT